MHAISSYRGNRPTPPARPLQTPESQTGPISVHCAAKLSTQCNKVGVAVVEDLYDDPHNEKT